MWTTLTAIKARVNVTNTSYDTMITQMINATEAWIKGWLAREYIVKPGTNTAAVITEWHDGDDKDYFLAREYPFTASDITTITINDSEIPARTSVTGAGWVIDVSINGMIRTPGWSLSDGVQNLKLEYLPGYGTATTDVPSPIVEAEEMIVVAMFNNRGDSGVKTERIGSVSKSMIDVLSRKDDAVNDALRLLDPYRRL